MKKFAHKLVIAYGSESGNAHTLSWQLKNKLGMHMPQYCELNDLDLTTLSEDDLLLIITSTTGDGEAPHNAQNFYRHLVQNRNHVRCRFAVFGLGSLNYDNFCGFSVVVDAMLKQAGATPIAKRVDADVDFDEFFDLWRVAVENYVHEEPNAAEELLALELQATE